LLVGWSEAGTRPKFDLVFDLVTGISTEYMNALFDVGYDLGRHRYHWQRQPPDY
jgi:hypothetical protein